MSIKVMTEVWQESKTKGSQLLLLLAIADFANDKGEAFPSIKTLAEKTRLSKRQTINNVKALEDAEELEVKRSNKVNRYKVVVKRLHHEKDKNLHPRSEVDCTSEVKPASTEPSINHQDKPSSTKREDTNPSLPDDGKPPKKRKRSYSTPPSVELYRRITHRYPAKKLHPRIDRAVGSEVFSDGPSLLKWGRIVRKWVASGWSPTNYDGMINVFRHGWRKTNNKNEEYVTPGVAELQKAYQRAEAEK